MIHVSKGNHKIGNTLNISLPPVLTCQPNVPCASKCYARKSYAMYPNVRSQWDENLAEYRKSPNGYFKQLWARLSQGRKAPAFFRWHVAGEIIDDTYFQGVLNTANYFADTKFLIYTRYPFERLLDGFKKPENLSIVKSYWLGFDRPYDENYPGFMVIAKDNSTRFMDELSSSGRVKAVLPCPGECATCRACWTADKDTLITNHIH